MTTFKHKYSKNIYDMELHEELIAQEKGNTIGAAPVHILRVPGGWIYYHPFSGGKDGTFVPLINEFQIRDQSIDDIPKPKGPIKR